MCFAAAIPIAISLAGAAVAAKGQLDQGKAAAASGLAAKGQADYEARVADHNATVTNMEGFAKSEAIGAEADKLQASQRAAAGASGVNPDVGSAALIQQETDKNKFLDQVSTLWNSQTQADSFKQQSAGLTIQGQNAEIAGKNAKASSKYAAAGTFLSGLGSAAGSAATARRKTSSLEIS